MGRGAVRARAATLLAGEGSAGSSTGTVESVVTQVETELAEHLGAFSADNGVTLNTMMQAGWGILLARQLGRTDVVFGATVSGRPPELDHVESMVGLFINTLPSGSRSTPRSLCVPCSHGCRQNRRRFSSTTNSD